MGMTRIVSVGKSWDRGRSGVDNQLFIEAVHPYSRCRVYNATYQMNLANGTIFTCDNAR